ncbi:MAG: AarF/UbiB family protein [Polyangiaceae bacterium]
MSGGKKVPEGRLARAARLAGLGVRTGVGFLRASGPSSEGDTLARATAETLGNLRGLAAKLGQMASYVDGIVPESHAAAYETALAGLRSAAPRSPWTDVKRTLEDELGKPVDDVFASFDTEPLASASIGQVHAARMRDGTRVAVKVQHAGIEAAMESDLANASMIEGLAKMAGAGRFDPKAMLEVVRARFREELDYLHEASNVDHFAKVHATDPRIVIPRVLHAVTTRRVLTTTFESGATFEDAIRADEPSRRAWANTLWRYVFRGNLVGGRFNADPHPGNYAFRPDGVVVFFDHGCIQTVDDAAREAAHALHLAALDGDEGRFRDRVPALVGSKPGRLEDAAVAYMKVAMQPLLHDRYRITRPYTADLLARMKTMAKAAKDAPKEEFFSMRPEQLFMNRLQFGFYSVLARLDVEGEYRAAERTFLAP